MVVVKDRRRGPRLVMDLQHALLQQSPLNRGQLTSFGLRKFVVIDICLKQKSRYNSRSTMSKLIRLKEV